MKIYMIILDGAADRKIKILGNKTPLQVANTPALDILARRGTQALITVIDKKITPESDSGSMALLSYDPKIYYPGRGTLEGLGTGFIPEGYNYVAFRVNFASYNEKLGILDRRTARGLEEDELQALAKDLMEKVDLSKFGVNFKLVAFGHHRGILWLSHRSWDKLHRAPGLRQRQYTRPGHIRHKEHVCLLYRHIHIGRQEPAAGTAGVKSIKRAKTYVFALM